MSDSEVLNVEIREETGKRNMRRMRSSGRTPAVLYGHGEQSVNLSVKTPEVSSMIRHGSRVVELKGGLNESAFVKEIQWDAFGSEVLHLDLTRVSKGELVETTVSVELRGDAPGTKSGGIIQHELHSLEVKCPVHSIPEKIEVNINSLELDQAITVADLALPEGASTSVDSTAIVVQCVEPAVESEEAATADGAEPEIIGRKADEDGEGDD